MKKDRKAQKYLNDLYFWLDYKNEDINENDEIVERFFKLNEFFEKKFSDRNNFYNNPYDYYEYYGMFSAGHNRIKIDPKRYSKKMGLTKEQLLIMGKRHTTYYYPSKINYSDYDVNYIVDIIKNLKEEYNKRYRKIIKTSVKSIKYRKILSAGDYDLLMCGISGPNAANAWANYTNYNNVREINNKRTDLLISLFAQFFHHMASAIEAASIKIYTKHNPNMDKWRRDKLYDNMNDKKISSRTLPSFKYHDRLYLIWNFLKHNNMSTYNNLKRDYPEILIDNKYESGESAVYYLKLNSKVINEILSGVEQFFKEWCELNLNENYERAQWDYDNYFIRNIDDYMESFRNPLGLSMFDDLD